MEDRFWRESGTVLEEPGDRGASSQTRKAKCRRLDSEPFSPESRARQELGFRNTGL